MRNLFKKNISPKCEYCLIGKKINNDSILCINYGVTKIDHHCKKFKYDPLKRIPKKINYPKFEKKDFTI